MRARFVTLSLSAGLAAALFGCAAGGPRAATTQPDAPLDTNAELIEYISNQPHVAAEPAYRAVYILWKNEVYQGEFSNLAQQLEGAKIVSATWGLQPDSLLNRATVGYMLARTCDIRSGLNWLLTGLGRYAWMELTYKRIAHPAGDLGLMSGGEFLGILARAEEYLFERKGGEQVELGAEPGS